MADAAVVGSGPNGLAAAITLAKAGLTVDLFEAKSSVGGGLRSLSHNGFIHDICSAVHPLGLTSPFFSKLKLEKYGLEWIQPPIPLAHPLDDEVCLLERSVAKTAENLEEESYKTLMQPFVDDWPDLVGDLLGPLHLPKHPLKFLRFGYYGLQSAEGLLKRRFKSEKARALFAGLAAHSILPLDRLITASFALVLGTLAHVVGWPIPKGGAQSIANALASCFTELGGKIYTDSPITNIDQLANYKLKFFDTTPRQLLQIVGSGFGSCYRKRLEKYRYGPGVFKIDWALKAPIPWKHKECLQAGTVHVAGTWQDVCASEKAVWQGKLARRNFILLSQASLFDPTRGQHTAWAYCHVPHGSTQDMTDSIESQIEQVAPGFKECIIHRLTKNTKELESYNPNCIGGDIGGGVQDITQLFTRPVFRPVPYSTSLEDVYICSSSTPPGGGVHGMCGYWAATAALKKVL